MSFTVYKSSAGSGKTFTLVKEYLTAVIKEPSDFRKILAITFTNKAANEMKERVIKNLKELSSDTQNADSNAIKYVLPAILSETSLSAEQVQIRAKKALALILHNYSDFAISTIDSFVYKIIKTFAYDLHLPLNFEVELDASQILSKAIDILISKAGTDEELTNSLINYTETKINEEKDWRIEKELLRFSQTLMQEEGHEHIQKLKKLSQKDFRQTASTINKFIQNFKKQIAEMAKQANTIITLHDIDINCFYQGNKGIGGYFKRLENLKNTDYQANTYVAKTIEENKWYAGKADFRDKQAIDSAKTPLTLIYKEIQDYLALHLHKFNLYNILVTQIYPIAVLHEIENIVEEFKEQNNTIHISEFNKRISSIIFSEPVPFIYERLGEKYKSFLIDEFQDTSVLQWQNLLPLIDNSLSEGNFNMLVGDGKQAIYRWRSGEVEQFAHLPEIFRKENLPLANEKEQNLQSNYKEKLLNQNFRSKKEIIEFNNDFFRFLAQKLPEDQQNVYAKLEQECNSHNTGGLVQIEFFSKDAINNTNDTILVQVEKTIQSLLADNYHLEEIAILCRTNQQAYQVSNFLLEKNIQVISSESLLLKGSRELNLIISFIKFLLSPPDEINKAYIIQHLIHKKHCTQTFHEACSSIKEFASGKNTSSKKFIEFLHRHNIKFSKTALLKLPVYDLCEEIIRIFNLNNSADPYIQFFLDTAINFTIDGNSNLSDFVSYWEEHKSKSSVIIPEGLNAINIMTIHKAKGLEFPAVILPFVTDKLKLGKNNIWVDVQDSELAPLNTAYIPLTKIVEQTEFAEIYTIERNKSFLDLANMLYVAFTRPSERLYIFTEAENKKSTEINSAPGLLKYYLISKNQWDEDQLLYSFGEKQTKTTALPSLKKKTDKLTSLISENWRKKIFISTVAPEIWDIENPEKNKTWGKLIHYILSHILDHTRVSPVIDELANKGLIKFDKITELKDIIQSLVLHPKVKPFFEPGLSVKNEAEILNIEGQSLRPDRLIIYPSKLTIIDFKTGKPEEKHEIQIKKYATAIKGLGYNNIEMLLFYIDKEIYIREVF